MARLCGRTSLPPGTAQAGSPSGRRCASWKLKGLSLIVRGGGGAVVSTVSLDEALEMFDIRIGLECRTLRLAVPNMTEQDFTQLESICDDYERCGTSDPAEWGRLNRLFHAALYLPCDQPRLLALISTTSIMPPGSFVYRPRSPTDWSGRNKSTAPC